MAKPPGYVGYTMPQGIFFKCCVNDHVNPRYALSQETEIAAAKRRGLFSLFEFAIELNNNNVAIPSGHVFVAHVVYSWTRYEPCPNRPPQSKNQYYEKFGTPALDIQNFITGCESQVINFTRTLEYALIPDPALLTPIPQTEHAERITMTPKQETEYKVTS